MQPSPLLLVDIDGLRPDHFLSGLQDGRLPNLARLFGGQSLNRLESLPVLAPAPSITFTSQACLFTGEHPGMHGIQGNQFFDRFGTHSRGRARHYAFDVGDTLAMDDAVLVFSHGLADKRLQVPSVYTRLAQDGLHSAVIGHMYGSGADTWITPELADLARFTKGGNLFGLSAAEFDRRNLEAALDYLHSHGMPDVLTVYFMGVDHESHRHGPQVQLEYLSSVLDGYVGELWQAILESRGHSQPTPMLLLFSDHGQIAVPADDQHSLRLAFPLERELGHLFDALGLDVHDFPGEDPDCDAVVASNGGMAHVYLQNRKGRWAAPPAFRRDVLTVGRAFWEAHDTGRYATELHGALAGVLVRNVESDGWNARYQALTPAGELVSLEDWFAAQPADLYSDPVHRLNNLAGVFSGDILLVSDYSRGYYFAAPISGVHGGLHPQDSWATLALGWPEASESQWQPARTAFRQAIEKRCQGEGNRVPSTSDMVSGMMALLEIS